MSVTSTNWKNKSGTADRNCTCGTWRQHWLNYSNRSWPSYCSVLGCSASSTLGAHVYNANVAGEKIIPMCSPCNGLSSEFDLKNDVRLVSANKSETCG